jgi:hypothetical protein
MEGYKLLEDVSMTNAEATILDFAIHIDLDGKADQDTDYNRTNTSLGTLGDILHSPELTDSPVVQTDTTSKLSSITNSQNPGNQNAHSSMGLGDLG